MQQLVLDLLTPPAPTLAGFVPGRNTELLATLIKMGARTGREKYLYLWGEHGAGKSHLLHAVAASASGRFVAASPAIRLDFGDDDTQLLAIDDVEQLSDAGAIDLFNVFNARRESGALLLVSGPCPPARLKLRPDLVTRLAWGLVFQAHALTDGEKIAALQAHAANRGFGLGEDAGRYLLTHWRRDMASLFAALDALDRYSLETKRPVSVPLLREALKIAPRRYADPEEGD